MTLDAIIGLVLVFLAGLLAGICTAPIKFMKRFAYPHWALLSQFTGLILLPWLATFCLCPNAWDVICAIPTAILWKANLFSFAWGIANVLCGLCLIRIGFSLAIGLLVGVGLPIGVLLPMFFKGSGRFSEAPTLFSATGIYILAGVAILLIVIVLVTLAGFGRDRILLTQQRCGKGFALGFVMAVLAGVLQVGLSFAFVYTQAPISDALQAQGAGEAAANIGVWAVTLLGGAIPNLVYPAWRILKERSWKVFVQAPQEILLSFSIGLMFFLFLACIGSGMKMLGPLGASVGFGIYQAMQITGSQAVGIISGEWRGIQGRPRKQMAVAMGLTAVAVLILALSNAKV